MQVTPENAQKVGMVGGAVVLGFYLIGYYFGKSSDGCGCSDKDTEVSEAETRSTGVTRGTIVSESFGSEMDQDMSGSSSDLNRINPTVVEGAEDIMGAESFNVEYRNLNPLDYQTPAAFSEVSGYASQPFWDQANDYLPEYRFPMPWSASYSPLSPYRPLDYQQQSVTYVQTDRRVRPAVQNW
jgi:hypothetical protein